MDLMYILPSLNLRRSTLVRSSGTEGLKGLTRMLQHSPAGNGSQNGPAWQSPREYEELVQLAAGRAGRSCSPTLHDRLSATVNPVQRDLSPLAETTNFPAEDLFGGLQGSV
jgi:hypothetical protein